MAAEIRVKNWDNFQHYKDRSPPWIKLYNELLDDYRFACLQDASKMHLVGIWLLASRLNNRLPYDPVWISKKINATETVDLETLVNAGFVEVYGDGSDTLAERKQDATPRAQRGEAEAERETEEENSSHGASSDAPPPIKKRFPATPPKHGTEYAYPAEFEAAWQAYPKRDGGNPKMGAYKAWRARVVRGEPPDNLLAASEHYATHCAVKEMEGTGFVQQTATFYGPSEPYQEFVEGPQLNGHSPRSPPRPLTEEQKAQYRELRANLEASGMGPERAAEQAMEQVRGSP